MRNGRGKKVEKRESCPTEKQVKIIFITCPRPRPPTAQLALRGRRLWAADSVRELSLSRARGSFSSRCHCCILQCPVPRSSTAALPGAKSPARTAERPQKLRGVGPEALAQQLFTSFFAREPLLASRSSLGRRELPVLMGQGKSRLQH